VPANKVGSQDGKTAEDLPAESFPSRNLRERPLYAPLLDP